MLRPAGVTGRSRGVAVLPKGAPTALAPRVTVVSPHCDDAVLSLGASLSAHVRSGGEVRVVTVLAGDPSSEDAAGAWDRAAGFTSARDAATVRRAEDRAACARLGADARHLDEVDEQYPRRRSDAALRQDLATALVEDDEVLLPGYPLRHADHEDVTTLVLRMLPPDRPVRLYLEEPYALREPAPVDGAGAPWGSDVTWAPLPHGCRDVLAKLRAVRCYASQLPLLGPGRLPAPSRVASAATVAQLLGTLVTRGEWVTGAVPAGVLAGRLPAGGAA